MAEGPSTYLIDAWMNALGNATSFSVTTVYVKLHVGAPGSAGTSNASTETTRKACSFAASATVTGGRGLASDADITWTGISGGQDSTHFSLWDASSGGNFLGSGTITAAAYAANDTYTCPSGSLILAMTAAS